jgi:hypothetical protein
MKRILSYSILSFVLFAACSGLQNDPNKAAFVTLLGDDTLAVEQFVKTDSSITADVILRSPRTTFNRYELMVGGDYGMQSMTRTTYSLDEGFSGEGEVTLEAEVMGDSQMITAESRNGTMTRSILNERGSLPFIDMVHWPYELAINNALRVGLDTVEQKLLTGSRLSTFIIARIEDDSLTVRHPSRGVMGVNIDENGNLAMLDAGLTTRKLKVERVPSVDFDAIADRFASLDKSGNPFGSLSGAVEAEFAFNGAEFGLSYGQPSKRGRDIFGGIVPYGKRWRTGANRATHFTTGQDLRIGDLRVPAGEYTLFTIPEENDGTLIINKQTGQNGQTYNEEMDLGRVQMSRMQQDEVTEAFTIIVTETDGGGRLSLIWDQTVYYVDFEIL